QPSCWSLPMRACRAGRFDVQALLSKIRKEFQQLRQDRKMIPAMIDGPVMQLIDLGFAANLGDNHIPMARDDQDRTTASRALVERFTGSGYFDLVGSEETAQ